MPKRQRSKSPSRDKDKRDDITAILREINKRLKKVEHKQKKRSRSPSPEPSRKRRVSEYETSTSSSENSISTSDSDSGHSAGIDAASRAPAHRGGANLDSIEIDREQPPIRDQETGAVGVIEPDILSIIAESRNLEKKFSNPIQPEISTCWSNILGSGLAEDNKESLIQKYLPPENCQGLTPPKINPEIRIALAENTIRRDVRLMKLQEQVGAATSAVASLLTDLLKEGGGANKKHIESLNDVGRLLSDIHYCESVSRRELLLINLNKDLKDTLKTTPINEWLFGDNLDTTIKTAKELEKSSEQLRIQKRNMEARASTSKQGNSKRPLMRKKGTAQSGRSFQVSINQRREYYRKYQQHPTRRQDRRQPEREKKYRRS